MRGASTLKRVSRRRSLVGRVATPGGASSVRERSDPAMMRIADQHTLEHKDSKQGVRPFTINLYAWLVNSAGPLDGRRGARSSLFSASDGRLPGTEQRGRRVARPGAFPGAGVGGRGAGDGAAAGGGVAGVDRK